VMEISFLVELDKTNDQIMIIGATNCPSVLDGALRRAGRFDNVIEIPKPNFNGRIRLLLHYIFKLPKLDLDSVDINCVKNVAEKSNCFTASDFENLVNQAALFAGQQKKQLVAACDIEQGLAIIQHNKQALEKAY
jgi:ATP-dependent Zn protease